MKSLNNIKWFFFFSLFFSFPILADEKLKLKTTKPVEKIKDDSLSVQQLDLKIEESIRQMTDEEKIAQLLIVRTYAEKPIEEIFKVFIPGGFIHDKPFRKEKGYSPWLKRIKGLHEFSLNKTGFLGLYMVNQEGGLVNCMKDHFFKIKNLQWPYFDIPSPLKLTAVNNFKLVEEFAMELGKLLYVLGFNMNLAPVVDVFYPQRNGYIRGRSFSSDPYQVRKVSRAFTSGLQKAKIIATFKHFPGYSNTNLNSHNEFVTINISKKEFRERDGIPYHFQKGFSYPKAVMSNIALYPQLDKSFTAPLSKKIVTGILKKELGYEGLIITDDIGMSGYKESDLVQRAIKSFLAGNDMVLLVAMKNDVVIDIYKGMVRALKQGVFSKERLNESLKKILKLKSSLSYDKRSVSERLKSIQNSKKKLFQISKKMTQSMIDFYFKENPHLKNSLSKDRQIVSFSEESYKAVNNLKYFKKHKKEKTFLSLTDGHIGFCYGRITELCHKNFSKAQKRNIIMIDTRNKPLPIGERKQYQVYIPTYGFFPGVAEMFVKKMLQSDKTQTQVKKE